MGSWIATIPVAMNAFLRPESFDVNTAYFVYSLSTFNNSLWLAYGVLRDNYILIVSSVLFLVLSIAIIIKLYLFVTKRSKNSSSSA